MTTRISVRREDPCCEASVQLVAELTAELFARYQDLGPDRLGSFEPGDVLGPGCAFLVARLDERPVGCGALRPIDDETVEIKRMFVADKARRLGIGYMVLAELEKLAAEFGFTALRLETGVRQPEAIALYEHYDFKRIPAFGEYVGNPISVCFEKKITRRPSPS